MALNGIDISGYQPDIDLAAVDADFVIVKATGGTAYENPCFLAQADAALACGKLLGIYHFAGDGCAGTSSEEARHFLSAFAPYRGKAIPVLDWEAEAVDWDIAWAREWLDEVAAETGSSPWFYSYSSYVNGHDCSPIARYPLWLAAYYNGYAEMGYQADPPIYGGTGAWDAPTAYQYSSCGRVRGYGGRLDISVFYGGRREWQAFCAGDGTDEEVRDMQFLYRPDGKGEMRYHDGTKNIRLTHPDQMQAIIDNYKRATGRDIAIFALGTSTAPWAARFEQCFPLVTASDEWGD